MTISALCIGNLPKHPYIDNVYIDAISTDLQAYSYCIIDPVGVDALFSPSFSGIMDETLKGFRGKIYGFMSNGGRVICFMRPQIRVGETDNYSWLFMSPSNRTIIQFQNGNDCFVTSEAGDWIPYLEYSSLEWYAHWIVDQPDMTVLAYSRDDQILALRVSIGLGSLFIVPPIHDHNHKQIFIQTLRQLSEGPHSTEDVVPDWLMSFRLRREAIIVDEVAQLDGQLEDLAIQRDMKLQRLFMLGSLNDLLWGTGVDVLEKAVQKAFQELGFYAKPQGKIDLVLDCPIGKAYVEVEGTINMVRVRKVEQLLRYMLNEADKNVKGILVGNAFRLQDPKERPVIEEQFSFEVQEFAQKNNVAIIASCVLYDLVDRILVGEISVEEVQTLIFDTNGLLRI